MCHRDIPLEDLPNPFEDWPWISKEKEPPLTREEVVKAVLTRDIESLAYPGPTYGFGEDWSREQHVARVAYFCIHGWKDEVWVEVHGPGMLELVDGHHRVAAAWFRGKTTIRASVGGFIDELEVS